MSVRGALIGLMLCVATLGAHAAPVSAPAPPASTQAAGNRDALMGEYARLVGVRVDHATVRSALLDHLRREERRKRSPARWSTIQSGVAKADVAALERYLVHQLAHHYKTTELTAIVNFLRSPAGAALNPGADPKSEHAIKQKQAIDTFTRTPEGRAFLETMKWSEAEATRIVQAWIKMQADEIDPLPAEPARPASGW